MINPDENRFEPLIENKELIQRLQRDGHLLTPEVKVFPELVRPNGEPVPGHWPVFREGEELVVKDYTFKVKAIGEDYMLLEPVGPLLVKVESKPKTRRREKKIIKR